MEKDDWNYKEEFEELQKKYDLPKFDSLAEDFDIEKVFDKETDYLAREIRRVIVEKLSAYLHLFETLINPSAPPMFIFSVLRTVNNEDKEKIKKIYKKLSKLQIKVMKLDTVYSEKKETEFIKEAFKEWQETKKEVYKIIEGFEKNFDNGTNNLERGYFG